jgi:putative ubiquitin-RnfH superfamily antitoxin RatB of RatAB toxin-antitoxin module
MADLRVLQVTVACSPAPRQVCEATVLVPDGGCVRDALQACAGLEAFAGVDFSQFETGVWGRLAPLAQRLQALDRVELYRPLTVDPKVARRERFASQGTRGTGLFAKKRAGAKAGY